MHRDSTVKAHKKVRGGLQGKIFRMSIMLVVSAIIAFALLGLIQLSSLQKLADSTGRSETQTIKDESQQSMMKLTKQSLLQTVELAAKKTDGEFWTVRHDTMVLAEQVKDVMEHPENYPERDVDPPKMENAGKFALQLLRSDTAVPDEETMSLIRKMACLAPYMRETIDDTDNSTLDCYISFPNGYSLAMDNLSGYKFDDNGNVKSYDPTIRPWWKGAVETGDLYVSSTEYSELLELSDMEFGMPVYVDGRLAAVVEGSIRLEQMQQVTGKIRYGKSGFSVIIDKDGRLVCSPRTDGELAMDNKLTTDIRDSGNTELKNLVDAALSSEMGFRDITIDGEEYYVAYAPIETVGWTQMMFVPEAEFEDSTNELLDNVDMVTAYTLAAYRTDFTRASFITFVVMGLLIANAVIASLSVSGRIINPIKVMTQKVSSLDGDDMDFEMEDTYRTGDEIEILAETFGELSCRTKEYIRLLTDATSQKER